jgi:hypothetical protein
MLLRSEDGGVPRYSARQQAKVFCIGLGGELNYVNSKITFTGALSLVTPGLLTFGSILF